MLAMRHGGTSPRAIEAMAAEVREHLFELAPWLDQPVYALAVARFLRAEARELLMHRYFERVVEEQGIEAIPQRLLEQVTAAANLAIKASAMLGLDAQSHARLRATQGQAVTSLAVVERIKARGQRAMSEHGASGSESGAVAAPAAAVALDGTNDAEEGDDA